MALDGPLNAAIVHHLSTGPAMLALACLALMQQVGNHDGKGEFQTLTMFAALASTLSDLLEYTCMIDSCKAKGIS